MSFFLQNVFTRQTNVSLSLPIWRSTKWKRKKKLSLNLNEVSHSLLSRVWEFYFKSEILGGRCDDSLASLAHLLTRILDRCRPWPLCLKVFLMSSAEKPWFRIMCVLSLSWNRECCITRVAYVIVCVMAWYEARIDGFLITGFGIMWWGVASEDTHNPHKRDPRGPQAPQAQTNMSASYKLYILLFKKENCNDGWSEGDCKKNNVQSKSFML